MKKKVLFALIALFSFLSSWAADVVTVGGYNVTLDNKLVALAAEGPTTAPVASKVTTGASTTDLLNHDAAQSVYAITNGALVKVESITGAGNYFLKITADNKSLFVPFQVGRTGEDYFDFEYIWNSTTFNASVEDGILKSYYTEIHTSGDDFDATTEKPAWSAIAAQTNWRALMFPQINYKVKGLANNEECKVYVQYKTVEGTTETLNGTLADNDSYENGNFWMLSIPELYKGVYPISNTEDDVDGLQIGKGYVLNYAEGETVLPNGAPLAANSTIQDALEADFNWDYVQFFLVPTVDPFKLTVQVTPSDVTYAGANTTGPELTVKFGDETLPKSGDNAYTATWYNPDGTAMDATTAPNFSAVGTYTVVVSYTEGEENAAQTYYAAGEYSVKPLELTLGSGNLYKQYGDPDPTEPSYGTVYTQLATGDTPSSVSITGLVVKRTNTPAADYLKSEVVDTTIPYTIDDSQCSTGNENYTLSVTSVNSNIIVQPKYISEPEFTIIQDGFLTFNGEAQLPKFIITRKIGDEDVTLVEGTDYKVELFGDGDNVNANVRRVGSGQNEASEALDGRNKFAVKITGIGNYTSTNSENVVDPVIKEGIEIRQRNINTTDIANISDLTFDNTEQKPEPNVTLSVPSGLGTWTWTLTKPAAATEEKPADYKYEYSNNKYAEVKTAVNNAAPTCTIEATYTGEGADKKYTGNFYGTKSVTFTIKPFEFTIKPADASTSKFYGEADPELDIQTVPAALPQGLSEILTPISENVYYTISRVGGDHVGVYAFTINASLKGNQTTKTDPAHNYRLTKDEGVFEIFGSDYVVTSKFVQKQYDGTTDITSAGWRYYRRVQNETEPGEEVSYSYTEITGDAAIAKLKAVIGITEEPNKLSNRPRTSNNQSGTPGQDLGRWNILPDVTGFESDEYTLTAIARNDLPQNQRHQDDNICEVIKKNVILVAQNQTSVYGKSLNSISAKVYEGTELVKDDKGNITNKELSISLLYDAPIAYESATSNTPITSTSAVNTVANPYYPSRFGGYTVTNQWGRPNTRTLAQANPNYNIVTVGGQYTITAPTDQIQVALTWTKNFGQKDSDAKLSAVVTSHPDKESYTLTETELAGFKFVRSAGAAEDINANPGYDVTNCVTTHPAKLDVAYGYTYTAVLKIIPIGDVEIVLNNQTVNYGTEPEKTVASPYATVTGLDDLTKTQFDALGLEIYYEKPATGFIKEGAELKVKCNGVAIGTGETVTAAQWPWVANYGTVTVKSGKLYVNGNENITLDIAAFNKPWEKSETKPDAATYTLAQIEKIGNDNDQLIRDYAGTEVKSVTIICSKQGTAATETDQYTVKGNQWYSMVLPFKASPRDIQKIFNGYAAVDVLNKKNVATKASEIRFTLTVDSVPANEPFVAKTDMDFVFEPAIINATEDKDIMIEYPVDEDDNLAAVVEDGNKNQFIGTYKSFLADDATSYNLVNLSKGDISPANKDAYVRPLGAYFKVAEGVDNASAPLRIVFEEADGTTTVIEAVEAEGTAEVAYGEGWYTITGVKLDAEPITSGTYIYNGKKVFIQK